MLKSLYIKNFALISELKIEFKSGFTVITGETGAGKSIILGALALILGQRADNKSIKADEEKCVIEAEFDLIKFPQLKQVFERNDLDYDPDRCLIRRELTSTGKSRSFLNDSPVSLNTIKELSNYFIDIHSQHENLFLSNDAYQLEVVDLIAQNSHILKNYKQSFSVWKSLLSDLNKLEAEATTFSKELDFLQYQYKELIEANLTEGEFEELELENDTLSHIEEIKTELQKIESAFNEENSIISMLNECVTSISKVKSYLTNASEWQDRLYSSYVDLKDLISELSSFNERLEFSVDRYNWVTNRLSELFSLIKKHKVNNTSELITLRDSLAVKVSRIENFDELILELKQNIDSAFLNLKKHSEALTESRFKVFLQIETYLVDQLVKLGMPNIQFKINIKEAGEFGDLGKDNVEFLFSANKNRPLLPIAQIASGGEISRLMLSIKAMIANKVNLPTIIFDEIDTGVSGEIAHRMAEIMQSLSYDMQVITITHLPQIAAKGRNHFRVFKVDVQNETQTQIEMLNHDARINELAQMLSGKNISEVAVLNARELLQTSE